MSALFALLGYQSALLLRSQRWLPPFLLYGIILAVGIQPGRPVLDALGYSAAALLPVTAWLVRVCVTQEPTSARDITSAATSPQRVQLAPLLTALMGAGLLGCVGTTVVVLVSEAMGADNRTVVPLPEATFAGLLAAAVCALTGAAVAALCTRPLLYSRGWSLALTALGSLLALVTTGSPAKYAVTVLVSGSRTGDPRLPLLAFAGALLFAVLAGAAACAMGPLRGTDVATETSG
ncbi:ABC transporter [Streptomyces sp. NPDC005953]|uniref:ABC transporter n=1 Tax=Streptomyces sp. NPDC005953 TaxID=3156719 RepID=UPI0033EDDEE0